MKARRKTGKAVRRMAAGGLALLVIAVCVSVFAAEPQFTPIPDLVAEATNANGWSAGAATTNIAQLDSTNSMNTLDDRHLLALGDRLSFRIEEDQEDPKQLDVTDSGDLEVPYIGRFPADGKSCKQLAWELKTALEKEYYYQATVIIAVNSMARSRGKVYLVGAVHAPGPQEIPSDEVLTVGKAIMRAGGLSDFADKHNAKVTRQRPGGEQQTFLVDVAQVLDKGKTENDLALAPGDLILIPERVIRF
jgi:polysaccharide export outer membrane protein